MCSHGGAAASGHQVQKDEQHDGSNSGGEDHARYAGKRWRNTQFAEEQSAPDCADNADDHITEHADAADDQRCKDAGAKPHAEPG